MDLFENIQLEYYRRVEEESLARVTQCLGLLSEEQIWQRPNKSSNSVANIVLHLSGNIGQYINSALGKHEDNRKREKEFIPDQGLSRKEILNEFRKTVLDSVATIQQLKNKNLTQKMKVQCFDETPISIIIHVIEHTSYHVGQITWITKSILDKDLKYYGDLPLSETN